MQITVRPERPDDSDLVRAVLLSAFGRPGEADLVDALRRRGRLDVALVAEAAGGPVGYVAFSPVEVETNPQGARVAGLGPVGVAAPYQRAGVGERLVWEGLEACRRRGLHAVVVLGDPAYYGRFGFAEAARQGLTCEFDAPPGAFQAFALVDGALDALGGIVRYDPAFSAV